jgi:tRNA A-37 threonylcarbamoyl transferase component Bud32
MADLPNGRRFHFDPTVNLGHLISATVFLVTAAAAWVNISMRVDQQARDVARIETQLLAKIKEQEAVSGKFELNYREDMRDVKALLNRIEDKLDRKADKPR